MLALDENSLAIIKQKKSLLVLCAANVILLTSLLFVILQPLFHIEKMAWETDQVSHMRWLLSFSLLLGFFFVMHFLNVFFDAAVTVSVVQIVNHHSTHIGICLKTACQCFLSLLWWTLILSTAGIVIRFLEYWWDRWPTFKFSTNFLSGLPWLIAIFFVVPMLVIEKKNVNDAIAQSAQLIKKTWGAVNARATSGYAIFFIKIMTLIPMITAMLLGGKVIVWIGSAITFLLFLAIFILHNATKTVSYTAFYLYASGNQSILQYYKPEILRKAFTDIK